MPTQPATGYLAAPGYEAQLQGELETGDFVQGKDRVMRYGRLFLTPSPPRPMAWAANVWHDVQRIPFVSIGEGARALRALQANWAAYAFDHHRRTALVQARLPHVAARPLRFLAPPPGAPLGSWCLADGHTMVIARRCSSPVPHGQWRFEEDRYAPPSRAYLKLWEALTRLGTRPGPSDVCLDLGSSPGGWTWVLQGLGARVISVDKAPLAPSVAALPGVQVLRESAFGVDPRALPEVTWLLSDVACYPTRLLGLVERWLVHSRCRGYVCSVKFQGKTDLGVAARFAEIGGSHLVHLHHNKHELTWMLIRP